MPAKIKRATGLSILVSLPLTIIIHYLLFSKLNLHPTIHAFIGAIMFFLIVGTFILIFEKK